LIAGIASHPISAIHCWRQFIAEFEKLRKRNQHIKNSRQTNNPSRRRSALFLRHFQPKTTEPPPSPPRHDTKERSRNHGTLVLMYLQPGADRIRGKEKKNVSKYSAGEICLVVRWRTRQQLLLEHPGALFNYYLLPGGSADGAAREDTTRRHATSSTRKVLSLLKSVSTQKMC
jgi:hypothetical protein